MPYHGTKFVKPLTSYTCQLAGPEASALAANLRARGYEFRTLPYAKFAAAKDKVNVVLYESGKLVVQGKGTQDFVEFLLEPEILRQARVGYETVLDPELLWPRLGVDESGKGDFFGPLCSIQSTRTLEFQWRERAGPAELMRAKAESNCSLSRKTEWPFSSRTSFCLCCIE